jgi:membrane associated rhomboid family serine protease
MRPAAVGFHCPDEGGTGRGSGRARGSTTAGDGRPRTVLGGRVAPGRPGLVTEVLIGICAVAYVLQGLPLTGGGESNGFTVDFGLLGYRIAVDDEYYRLVTAAFLHVSLLHILINMYALYLVGSQLEAILGRSRYLGLFLACAVGGNTLSYLVKGLSAASVGASTAIFGFFAAYYVIARRLRADTSQILIIVGLNLLITFTVNGIDRWGHLGGLATGLLVGLLYAYVPPRRAVLQAAGVIAVLGLLVLATMLKTNAIT